jgi:MFS family permease
MILPQSVLLGMTFPLMSAGVLRAFPDRPGRSVALLYFTNSMGAAVGVLVSGFFLVRVAGLPGTIRIAGLLNLAVALALWYLASSRGPSPSTRIAAGVRPADWTYAFFLGSPPDWRLILHLQSRLDPRC